MIALIAVLRSAANISSAAACREAATISRVNESDAGAVDVRRTLGSEQPVLHIREHELVRPAARIAEAAAAAGVDADHVALVDREPRRDRELLHRQRRRLRRSAPPA